ncbi:MAG: hypothetical protein IT581_12215 [Verrucomicrobiales bacterium]|nr:hypothetical protein [Verrucomicrobiales bacterium]
MKKRRTETATCAICKKPFVRDAQASRKAKVCQATRCRKIMKLGHEKPVSLASIPTGNPSFLGHQNNYHGGYTE